MISSWMMYFFLMMDGIVGFFIVLTIILGCCILGIGIYTVGQSYEYKHWGKLLSAITISIILSIAIPTTKQTAIIFGVPYLLEKSSEIHLDKVPVKVVDYLNTYLDKEITKMKGEKK
jgi:predicted secreted protein